MNNEIIDRIREFQFDLEGVASQKTFLESKTQEELLRLLDTLQNMYYDKFYSEHEELKDHRLTVS